MADARWTMSVSVCKVCDKDRDPLDVPHEWCGHESATHGKTVGVEMVPAGRRARAAA
jgi:hypothetical protein